MENHPKPVNNIKDFQILLVQLLGKSYPCSISKKSDISKMRESLKLIFGQVVVLMSTPYPENLSFKLALSLKIGGFE